MCTRDSLAHIGPICGVQIGLFISVLFVRREIILATAMCFLVFVKNQRAMGLLQ